MFIHKAEEEALGINQNATKRYRSNNQIPDSDEFAIGKKKADQRQYPPIYLISMIQIAPDMQIYCYIPYFPTFYYEYFHLYYDY